MVWKQVANADSGDADHAGGNDFDKISQAFSGVDVDDFDINLDCKIRSGKLQIRNPANTFAYIHTAAALAADRIVNWPLLTATDTVTFNDFAATLKNKTLDSSCSITLPNDTVTYAQIQNISNTDKLLGRDTAGAGDTEEISVTNGLTFTGSGGIGIATSPTITTPVLTTPTINGEIDAVVTKTSADTGYTLTATNRVIRADATSGNLTLNLPSASGIGGTTYTIVRIDVIASTNMVTVDPNSTETIDGVSTWRLRTGEKIVIQSDGTNWITLYHPNPTAHGYFFLKNSTNDRRYTAGIMNNAVGYTTSNVSPAANTLWALPFVVGRVTKFDTISFWITTADASDNANAGIYHDNGNMYPGALIFNTGSISTGTTGIKNTTITAEVQVFQPGLYWLAWETSATALQMYVLSGTTAVSGLLGHDNVFNNNAYGYSVADTYGATLPDPYPGSATILATAPAAGVPVPALSLRPI